jgi:hypothetical protein
MRAALLVILTACSSEPSSRASCSSDANGKVAACLDLTGTDTMGFQNLCDKLGATTPTTFRLGVACPTANRVGSCLQNKGTAIETILRTYAPVSTEMANAICGNDEFNP